MVFAYSIIDLNSAFYNFKNTVHHYFKSTKALFIHAKIQVAFKVTSEVRMLVKIHNCNLQIFIVTCCLFQLTI